MSNTSEAIKPPSKITYEQIVFDLSSIKLNEIDPLFDENSNSALERDKKDLNENEVFLDKLEKLVIFKSNLELSNEKLNSELCLESLNKNLESLDKHINSLQSFIDVSKKFLSINRK